MAVLSETRAKGPYTDRLLAIVVAGDLGIVLLFTLSTTLARLLDGSGAAPGLAALHVAWELIGSVLAGTLAGYAVVLYRALVDRRSDLVVAGEFIYGIGTKSGATELVRCRVNGGMCTSLGAFDPGKLIAWDDTVYFEHGGKLYSINSTQTAPVTLIDFPDNPPMAVDEEALYYMADTTRLQKLMR